jgi:ElaB/YqjD/DUF883 family membrane-anchored ribosome-binding protein
LSKIKITYTKGCFDELAEEMTQEEIDALTQEIQELADSGELFDQSYELTEEEAEEILSRLNSVQRNTRQ